MTETTPGPHETTGAYRPGGLAEDMATIERQVAANAKLQATKHEYYTLAGQLWVRVEGASYEAHAWHTAVGGKIFGSTIDRVGVRRQMIFGSRVGVEVIDDPRTRA